MERTERMVAGVCWQAEKVNLNDKCKLFQSNKKFFQIEMSDCCLGVLVPGCWARDYEREQLGWVAMAREARCKKRALFSDPFHATNSLERTADYLSTRLLWSLLWFDLGAQQQFATAGILEEKRALDKKGRMGK